MDYNFNHAHPIQVRFNDIDMLGHTTNSVHMQYFDLGRLHYFLDVLKERMDWEEEGLIVVSVNVNFLAQIKFYDDLEVRTKIVKMGNKSLEMIQQIYNKTTKAIAADCKSIMVGYCGKDETSISLPNRWRKGIAAFEKDIIF